MERDVYTRLLEAALLASIIGVFMWTGLVWTNAVQEQRLIRGAAQRTEMLKEIGELKTEVAGLATHAPRN